jgi:hypothetical protein
MLVNSLIMAIVKVVVNRLSLMLVKPGLDPL